MSHPVRPHPVRRRLCRLMVAGLALAALSATGLPPAHAEFGTDYADPLTAQPPLQRPDTASCPVEVMHERAFANGFGDPPDTPLVATLTPPAGCPGPWSAVLLDLTGHVAGRQFDRLFAAYIGGVQVMLGSTPEPSADGIAWHVERDLTRYAPLLTGPRPFVFDLQNVTDDTFTGIFYLTATVTFYRTSPRWPASASADQVLTVSTGATTAASALRMTRDAPRAGRDLTFPRNLTGLTAEVYTRGGGTCEEFSYAGAPPQFAAKYGVCGAGPFRELRLSIDGRLAGVVWPYPVIYTGGFNPLLWRPIPAIFAFDLPAYQVDLTPFVGLLVDGRPHRIDLEVNAMDAQANDGWIAQANLFATVDHRLRQTAGGLTAYRMAPQAAVRTDATDRGNVEGTFHVVATRHDAVSGWVATSRGVVRTEVRADLRFESRQDLTDGGNHDVLANTADLTWRTSTRPGIGPAVTRTVHENEPLFVDYTFTPAPGDGFDLLTAMRLGYHRDEAATSGGRRLAVSTVDHTMASRAHNVTGDAPLRTGTQHESYSIRSAAGCHRRSLDTVDGYVTVDRTGC